MDNVFGWQNHTQDETAELQNVWRGLIQKIFSHFHLTNINNQEKFDSFHFFIATFVLPQRELFKSVPIYVIFSLNLSETFHRNVYKMSNDKHNVSYRKSSYFACALGKSSKQNELAGVQRFTNALTSSEHSFASTDTYVYAEATQIVV